MLYLYEGTIVLWRETCILGSLAPLCTWPGYPDELHHIALVQTLATRLPGKSSLKEDARCRTHDIDQTCVQSVRFRNKNLPTRCRRVTGLSGINASAQDDTKRAPCCVKRAMTRSHLFTDALVTQEEPRRVWKCLPTPDSKARQEGIR